MVAREVLSDKMTFEQNPKETEEASPVTTWEKSIPGRENDCAKVLRISEQAGVNEAVGGKENRR